MSFVFRKIFSLWEKHQNQDTFLTFPLSLLCQGVFLFILGMGINIHSDYILRQLRKPGEITYKIPQGNVSPALWIPILPWETSWGIMLWVTNSPWFAPDFSSTSHPTSQHICISDLDPKVQERYKDSQKGAWSQYPEDEEEWEAWDRVR